MCVRANEQLQYRIVWQRSIEVCAFCTRSDCCGWMVSNLEDKKVNKNNCVVRSSIGIECCCFLGTLLWALLLFFLFEFFIFTFFPFISCWKMVCWWFLFFVCVVFVYRMYKLIYDGIICTVNTRKSHKFVAPHLQEIYSKNIAFVWWMRNASNENAEKTSNHENAEMSDKPMDLLIIIHKEIRREMATFVNSILTRTCSFAANWRGWHSHVAWTPVQSPSALTNLKCMYRYWHRANTTQSLTSTLELTLNITSNPEFQGCRFLFKNKSTVLLNRV